ncbi:hypothetical protein [Streptomyces olivochromogenes]|uniref:Uncharacterized protein n=1 Tax=Streptomyces olivochromogenes TaxID=1963 RepID=A0A250VT89_STROL|nr:hypothetical protein [Streptomyces olivochromogenes]KUN38184.1 hypothetical protein AQJ27_44580 [Streptomyces olivochromogenes]GAX57242.1 hypothetical protein SO3561_08812 [Streptomyces olivochromogenes]
MTDTAQLTDIAAGALNQLCPAAAMAIVLQGDPKEILQHVIEAVLAGAAVQQQAQQEAEETSQQATILPIRYVVSSLPEGHEDRYTFTINVHYRGNGQYSITQRLRCYGTDGTWSYEPDFGEDDQAEAAWLATHQFDHDAALKLARELAPTLTYRGRTVADALKESADA